MQFRWHRMRRKPKGCPDPEEYHQKKAEWEALKKQEATGVLDVLYFDASGFCFVPYIPYAWQEQGSTMTREMGCPDSPEAVHPHRVVFDRL